MPVTETLHAPTLVPFAEDHLDGAVLLLPERHRAQRAVERGLDPRFEDAAATHDEIREILGSDDASGAAAISATTSSGSS